MYQKAFVELFMAEPELDAFAARAEEEERKRRASGVGDEGVVKWFAGNRRGESRSNMGKGDVNAVTWGVFGGREIVTTTMIEEMSFKAWKVRLRSYSYFSSLFTSRSRTPSPSRLSIFALTSSRGPQEEAFSIWMEWSHLYPANSPSRAFIQNLADTRWLVSVVHHDYKDEDGLWKWLLEESEEKVGIVKRRGGSDA